MCHLATQHVVSVWQVSPGVCQMERPLVQKGLGKCCG